MARASASAARKEAKSERLQRQLGGVDSNTLLQKQEEISSLKQDAAESSMEVANAFRLLENEGINKDAFQMCQRFLRMEAGKAKAIIKCFDLYRPILLAEIEKDLFNADEGKVAKEETQSDAKPCDTGVKAGKNGLGAPDNPFDNGTPEYMEWHDGWTAGQTSIAASMAKKAGRRLEAVN